ncbi:phytanoyl-CoA dioxygenase family protein [Thalassotalea piscium]
MVEQVKNISECKDFNTDAKFKDLFKPSVLKYTDYFKTIPANNPCIDLYRNKKILDIANGYHQMWSKIRNVNFWINPVIAASNHSERKGSQQWHRDQEDERILKCFIYFSDVYEKNGATEYVPYSRCNPERKYSKLWPYPSTTGYPSDYLFESEIDPSDIVKLEGRKGTIAFLDTNGFHRGALLPKVIAGYYVWLLF